MEVNISRTAREADSGSDVPCGAAPRTAPGDDPPSVSGTRSPSNFSQSGCDCAFRNVLDHLYFADHFGKHESDGATLGLLVRLHQPHCLGALYIHLRQWAPCVDGMADSL